MTASRRIATLSILASAGLAIAKIAVGIAGQSVAVVSDGIESCGDVLTSGLVLVAVRLAAKPADADHPYGHGRIVFISVHVPDKTGGDRDEAGAAFAESAGQEQLTRLAVKPAENKPPERSAEKPPERDPRAKTTAAVPPRPPAVANAARKPPPTPAPQARAHPQPVQLQPDEQ